MAIPATHLLKKKDLIYRNNAANIKAIIAVNDAVLLEEVDESAADSPTLRCRIVAEGESRGWLSLEDGMADASAEFPRPSGEAMTQHRGHDAPLFHLRHHRHAENGAAQLCLSTGAYPHREILAKCPAKAAYT